MPVSVTLLKNNGAVPAFVAVTVCGAEVVPCDVLNVSEVALSCINGATPEPVRPTTIVEADDGSLLLMVIVAVFRPVVAGWKVTLMMQVPPGARLAGHALIE